MGNGYTAGMGMLMANLWLSFLIGMHVDDWRRWVPLSFAAGAAVALSFSLYHCLDKSITGWRALEYSAYITQVHAIACVVFTGVVSWLRRYFSQS